MHSTRFSAASKSIFFRFGIDVEEVTLPELAEDVGQQLLLGVVAHGVNSSLRL